MRVSIILIGLGLMLGLPTNVQAGDKAVKCGRGQGEGDGEVQRLPSPGRVQSDQEGPGARFLEVR